MSAREEWLGVPLGNGIRVHVTSPAGVTPRAKHYRKAERLLGLVASLEEDETTVYGPIREADR